jgi:hypothetical protein
VNEQRKLDEAHYFLKRMGAVLDNPVSFGFEVSAFLSAARTVLQYAHAEAKTKSGGQQWYDAGTKTPVVSYFKDKRDYNIHAAPVALNKTVAITAYESVPLLLSESVKIEVRDDAGNLIHQYESPPPPPVPSPLPAPERLPTSRTVYTFYDWKGVGEVIELSERYLAELEAIVADGQSRGFLTS